MRDTRTGKGSAKAVEGGLVYGFAADGDLLKLQGTPRGEQQKATPECGCAADVRDAMLVRGFGECRDGTAGSDHKIGGAEDGGKNDLKTGEARWRIREQPACPRAGLSHALGCEQVFRSVPGDLGAARCPRTHDEDIGTGSSRPLCRHGGGALDVIVIHAPLNLNSRDECLDFIWRCGAMGNVEIGAARQGCGDCG